MADLGGIICLADLLIRADSGKGLALFWVVPLWLVGAVMVAAGVMMLFYDNQDID